MPRPRKYDENEKRVLLNVYIPAELVKELDKLAFEKGITRTELVHSLLAQVDKKFAVELSTKLNNLHKTIRELIKLNKQLMNTNKSYEKRLMKYEERLNNLLSIRTVAQFYKKIEADEELKKWLREGRAYNYIKARYKKCKKTLYAPKDKDLASRLAEMYEEKLLEEGRIISLSKKELIAAIVSEIKNIDEEILKECKEVSSNER